MYRKYMYAYKAVIIRITRRIAAVFKHPCLIAYASVAKCLSIPAHTGRPQPVVGSQPGAAGQPTDSKPLSQPR